MKSVIKNYTFDTVAKTITLTDITTVRLDKLALITDVTTNKILYNFADPTLATATVATNVITLSVLQGGEVNGDKLRIDYDVESSDTLAFADATTPVSSTSLPLPTGASTSAKQDTIIGHVDGIESLLTTIDGDTGNIATEVAGLLTDTELRASPVPVSGTFWQSTQPVSLASVPSHAVTNAGTFAVQVSSALPAGTNAIGKLSANSGVDIGDVDVTSAVSATMDHGSNRDIDTSAEQITSTSFACKFGVTLKADITNTGIIYVGNSDVTAGTTAATDGFPLSAGETVTLEVTNANIPYAIVSVNNQIIYWVAV